MRPAVAAPAIRTKRRVLSVLRRLGPGLVTGASDDDPSGIATYSQAGAQFGYGMLWTLLFSYPLMCAVQEISARIGRVTGRGIVAALRSICPRPLLLGLIFLLFVANTINLAADLGAMGDAFKLLAGGRALLWTFLLGILSIGLEIWLPYARYAHVLKWLTLALFAYVITAFFESVHWGEALRHTLTPALGLKDGQATTLIAVLGTTISPYLFFWQAAQEAEEVRTHPRQHPLRWAPQQAPTQLARIKFDTYSGMALSNIVAWFIILATGTVLFPNGITKIETSTQAANALKPLAGHWAFVFFAAGIIGTGLLALPVLAGSAAFALGEALRWPVGLERAPKHAKVFYGILAGCTLAGAVLNFAGFNPIRALYWAAVLNGIAAVPMTAVLMIVASNRRIMGPFVLSTPLKAMGWLTAGVMTLTTICLFTH